MAKTGYLVSVYMDANPYSPTYGQERTERELNTEECKTQQPANYVHVYTYCEMNPNGSYTGNCVKVYEDVEPLSPTYGNQMEEVYTDGVLCPPDSADADWRQIDQYCEQIAYQPSGKMGNSGYMVTVYRDMGEYSPTYNQTREDKTQDLVHCTPPNTEDVWVIISETCHLVDGLKDGTKDVVRVNTNEYSPNYNDGQSETVNVEDLTMCPLDPESPIWTETSYVCVMDDGYRTGYVTVTEEDTNPQSASYGQTRTRTYQDLERCPYQPKPQPVTLKWRVVNNRSASTDAITHITLHFNNNFDIDILGSGISPAGGRQQGTVNLPASLTSTGLVLESVELSPNTSLPILFQTQQTPSPFVWSDTAGSAVLTVTLWDGDGTGPEWTEVSYTCETAGGYRTGASIVVEEDTNPDSGTYGQQRTRTIENDSRCPAQTDGDWVETSWSCQQESGYNTGNVLSVQTDQNPNSSTYNQTRTRIISDTTRCPLDTTAAWTEVSYVCEQVDGKYNTGTIIITETDINPGSATYNTTRTRTATGDSRCVRNENPDWVEESYVCEQDGEDVTPNWVVTSRICLREAGINTGYAAIIETDINPYSATYNETRTTTVEDLVDCKPRNYKLLYTATNNGGGQIACNGGTTLTSSDTSSTKSSYVTAEIGDCVLSIGEKALQNCSALTSVDMSNNVTTIGTYAFSNSPLLATVNLSKGLRDIGTYSFYRCTGLTAISIPSGVELISNYAFQGCSSLASVTLPDTVTSLGKYAFSGCSSLANITLPSSVTSIAERAFSLCTSLTSIVIPDGVTKISGYTFSGCSSLSSVTIPSGVTSIEERAFQNCTSLTSISIPSGVTRINEYTFYNSGLTSVTIPSGVTEIRDYAFYQCTDLASVDIPNTVTVIRDLAFCACESLQSVNIPDSVGLIEYNAFRNCTGLETLTIGSGMKTIHNGVFNYCSGLTSITITATTPPTLGGNEVFDNTNNCPIYVPAESVDLYKRRTYWSEYASRIQAIPS